MPDFSDRTRTGISILTSAADFIVEEMQQKKATFNVYPYMALLMHYLCMLTKGWSFYEAPLDLKKRVHKNRPL